nr:MAG: hypothetical protein 3 [Leviviridae sp.]
MRKIPHWLEELSPNESLDVYRELAYRHACEGGAVGRQICELIRKNDLKALVEFELNYSDPTWSAYAVKQCRQALAFFQKLPDLRIGIDKEAVALQKFLEAEELCRETNEILSMCRTGRLSWPNRVNAVFHGAVRKIAHVLGPVPSISELDLRFGPGATRGVKRSEASTRRKIAEKLQCSEELLPLVPMLMEELPHLVSVHELPETERIEMKVVGDNPYHDLVFPDGLSDEDYNDWESWRLEQESNWFELQAKGVIPQSKLVVDEMVSVPVEIVQARLNFVPKSAKTYRSVNVEAGLNVMFQLGIGDYMAKRLAKRGIDIRDQTLNQRRAREGSLTGALATLDLSSASDTISREIVFELLPLEWAELLNWGRSSSVVLPSGKTISQEKFSSMGNGYTFPLETLIFWGLAAACCDRDSDATVYGDDIIIPSDKFDLLREVLHYAGFKVNVGKSFATGPFRESCGKDYFRGMDVRPFYAKGWVSGQLLFVLHNFYVRDHNPEMAKEVEDLIHPALKLWGPDGYGDGHLVGDHPRDRPLKYHVRGFGGYFFDSYTTKQRKELTSDVAPGDYVLPLYTIYRRGDEEIENSLIPVVKQRVKVEQPGSDLNWTASWVSEGEILIDFNPPTQYKTALKVLPPTVKFAEKLPVKCAPLPLPEKKGVKALTLPGVDGYKKITIYTLGS